MHSTQWINTLIDLIKVNISERKVLVQTEQIWSSLHFFEKHVISTFWCKYLDAKHKVTMEMEVKCIIGFNSPLMISVAYTVDGTISIAKPLIAIAVYIRVCIYVRMFGCIDRGST